MLSSPTDITLTNPSSTNPDDSMLSSLGNSIIVERMDSESGTPSKSKSKRKKSSPSGVRFAESEAYDHAHHDSGDDDPMSVDQERAVNAPLLPGSVGAPAASNMRHRGATSSSINNGLL